MRTSKNISSTKGLCSLAYELAVNNHLDHPEVACRIFVEALPFYALEKLSSPSTEMMLTILEILTNKKDPEATQAFAQMVFENEWDHLSKLERQAILLDKSNSNIIKNILHHLTAAYNIPAQFLH